MRWLCPTWNGTGSVGSYEDVPELPQTEPTEFGKWMRKARERHGTSLIRLRDLTGITPSRLSQIERGAGEPATESEEGLIRFELGYIHRKILKAESDAKVDAELAEEDRKRQIRKAAPDLLAALKDMVEIGYTHEDGCHPSEGICTEGCFEKQAALVQARAAIRKAEGEGA